MREENGQRRVAMIEGMSRAGISLAGMAAVSLAQMGATMQVKSSRLIEGAIVEPPAPDQIDVIPDLDVSHLLPITEAKIPTREEMICSSLMALLPGVYICELRKDNAVILVRHHSGQSVEIPVAEVEKILELGHDERAIRLRVAQYYAAQNGYQQPTTADQNALAQANAKRDRKAAKRKELLCRSP